MWEKKMEKQGYNYLDSPVHCIEELFESSVENFEKSIPPSVSSKNKKKSKKGSKKRKSVAFWLKYASQTDKTAKK